MVLTQVQAGEEYIIHAIDGDQPVRLHLEGMGFVPGTKLKVVSRIGENMVVTVKGVKFALDGKLAKCVVV